MTGGRESLERCEVEGAAVDEMYPVGFQEFVERKLIGQNEINETREK